MVALAPVLAAGHLLLCLVQPIDFQLAPAGIQTVSPAPLQATPEGEPSEADGEQEYSIAHGFGNAVPLSFAIKQIVPASFRVRFRGPVDPSLTVTWSGGRPWTQVLSTMLRQHGLHSAVFGQGVTIGY